VAHDGLRMASEIWYWEFSNVTLFLTHFISLKINLLTHCILSASNGKLWEHNFTPSVTTTWVRWSCSIMPIMFAKKTLCYMCLSWNPVWHEKGSKRSLICLVISRPLFASYTRVPRKGVSVTNMLRPGSAARVSIMKKLIFPICLWVTCASTNCFAWLKN